uniref:Uncharacterized protein n=1 Tax=Tanacetum cinerariifolium TaxID=118510 RepID=A0A6L2L868_TANCI|nr:hypothetical protein [Tanacetum cinerariifolium]
MCSGKTMAVKTGKGKMDSLDVGTEHIRVRRSDDCLVKGDKIRGMTRMKNGGTHNKKNFSMMHQWNTS